MSPKGDMSLPNRESLRAVVLSCTEPDNPEPGLTTLATYSFYIPACQVASFKERAEKAGGTLEKEHDEKLSYTFKKIGGVLTIHNLAMPYMFKY